MSRQRMVKQPITLENLKYNNAMKKITVLLAICLLQHISYAQIETNYYLKNSMGMRIKSLSRGISTKTFTIPTFDVDKLRQEDEALSDSDIP